MERSPRGGWTAQDIPDLHGVSVVITGATAGIGLETTRLLADHGARVILGVRNAVRGDEALADLRSHNPDADVLMGRLDLADLASVRGFAAWMDENDHRVDVLINNAGVMAVPRTTTVDGFELQMATNHLGHFALTGLLLVRLLAHGPARVVTVTSLAHRRARIDFDDLMSERSYGRYEAYRQSKLANLLFTMELQRRFRQGGRPEARSVAAHPGLTHTNLLSGITDGGPLLRRGVGVLERLSPIVSQPAADGALPVVRAAADPSVDGGDVFGPAGFGQVQGPAAKVKAAPRAYDVHDARALWERSIQLTGVDYSALSR